MIPRAMIAEWRELAPWPTNDQVEHDLVLSRALCELYSDPILQETLVSSFMEYMRFVNANLSSKAFTENLIAKKNDSVFMNDIFELLVQDEQNLYDPEEAFEMIFSKLIPLIR